MRKVITVVLWIFALTSLLSAYLFASFYMIQIDDFVQKDGIVRGELNIKKDEYGNNVSLRFNIEGDEKEYSLAGKLLERTDVDVYNLKAGDAVRVWLKKEEARHFFDQFLAHLEGVWGIERVDGAVLLPLETAVAYRKGGSSLVYMAMFLITGFSFLFYIFKRNQQPLSL